MENIQKIIIKYNPYPHAKEKFVIPSSQNDKSSDIAGRVSVTLGNRQYLSSRKQGEHFVSYYAAIVSMLVPAAVINAVTLKHVVITLPSKSKAISAIMKKLLSAPESFLFWQTYPLWTLSKRNSRRTSFSADPCYSNQPSYNENRFNRLPTHPSQYILEFLTSKLYSIQDPQGTLVNYTCYPRFAASSNIASLKSAMEKDFPLFFNELSKANPWTTMSKQDAVFLAAFLSRMLEPGVIKQSLTTACAAKLLSEPGKHVKFVNTLLSHCRKIERYKKLLAKTKLSQTSL